MRFVALASAIAICAATSLASHHATFSNTVYLEPDVITADDPTAFQSIRFVEKVTADLYAEDCNYLFSNDKFYHFEATYTRSQRVTFLIDRRFKTPRLAQDIAQIYAPILGQMPHVLREGVSVIIVRFTGSNWCAYPGHIEIEHADYSRELAAGALEESMMHETVHATLDEYYLETQEWQNAMALDRGFVSAYAERLPDDEDLSETFTAYYGMVKERHDPNVEEVLELTVPARLEYLRKEFPISRLSIE